MLKLYAIVGCLLLGAFDRIDALPLDVAECAAANNVSDSDLEAYRQLDGFDVAYFDDKYNVKCYEYCFLHKHNVVDETGQFLYEQHRAAYDTLPDYARIPYQYTADQCQNSTLPYEDPCEASYQYAVCFQTSYNEYFEHGANEV